MVKRVVDIDESVGPIPTEPTKMKLKTQISRLKTIYENDDLLVIDKPAGVNADDFPQRVHRLDKDTSGVLIVAKSRKVLDFLQKQFQGREVKKKYAALITGNLKEMEETLETLLGRSPNDRRKQKVFLMHEPESGGKRTAVTKYRVLQRFKNYDLIEVEPLTGRKHQIRAHMAYLGHPIAGDKLYGFKNQPSPNGLKRQFLHAKYLEIKLPDGQIKKFESDLPDDLKSVISEIHNY